MSSRVFILLGFCLFLYAGAEEKDDFFFEEKYCQEDEIEINDQQEYYRCHPLNINKCSRADLLSLNLLTESDIEKILLYRYNHTMQSYHDLIRAGLGRNIITSLLPFISFHVNSVCRVQNLIRCKSALKNTYDVAFLQKTTMSYKRNLWGFISDKDAPEDNWLDFYSYFWDISGLAVFDRIILGRYRIVFGQGLVFSPVTGRGKGDKGVSVPFKNRLAIHPYTGTYEQWYLEGGTFTARKGYFSFTPFFSGTKRPVKLEYGLISSFDQNSIHAENSPVFFTREMIWGAVLGYDRINSGMQFLFSMTEFDRRFKAPELKNRYTTFSLASRYYHSSLTYWGETALKQGKIAVLQALQYNAGCFAQLLLLRYYAPDIPNWHNNTFAANSNPENERGIYYALELKFLNKYIFQVYFDLWRFPHPRYYELMPTTGSERYLNITMNLKNQSYYLHLKHQIRDKASSGIVDKYTKVETYKVKIDFEHRIAAWDCRTSVTFFQENIAALHRFSRGFLLVNRLGFEHGLCKIFIQLTVYHTKPLLYCYESSLYRSSDFLVLSKEGLRSCIVIKGKIIPEKLSAQFKIGGELTTGEMNLALQVISDF
ncbi:MAG: hypothetical protein JXB60_10070 [Candidatus Cloacimonetes bacterium]|nr:hypothetical protein [Candidatus Cloacimonadota bacterium]